VYSHREHPLGQGVARFYTESWQRAREAGFRAGDGIGERARSTTHAAAAEVGLDALGFCDIKRS
jgi:hypothetical protein